jgi:hypothetical protein
MTRGADGSLMEAEQGTTNRKLVDVGRSCSTGMRASKTLVTDVYLASLQSSLAASRPPAHGRLAVKHKRYSNMHGGPAVAPPNP